MDIFYGDKRPRNDSHMARCTTFGSMIRSLSICFYSFYANIVTFARPSEIVAEICAPHTYYASSANAPLPVS